MELQDIDEQKKGLQEKQDKSVFSKYRKLTVILIVIIIALIISLIIVAVTLTTKDCSCKKAYESKTHAPTRDSFLSCKNDEIVIDPTLEDKNDIFRQLNLQELHSIQGYISKRFQLKPKDLAPIRDLSYIQNIELYIPDKTNALKYLDSPPTSQVPERRARVTIVQAPYNITYYIVGPVPNPTHHELAKFNDRTNPLPFAGVSINKIPRMYEISRTVVTQMWKLFQETYRVLKDFNTPQEALSHGLVHVISGNVQIEGAVSAEMVWVWHDKRDWKRKHLERMGVIAVQINGTSNNESDWSVGHVIYNLKSYKNIQSLMELYTNKKLNVMDIKHLGTTIFKRRGSQDRYFPSSEPLTVSPYGPRFSVKGKKITYLDWQFNYIVQPSSGPALFDVRFKNERIAFEISLQEASSLYATGGPWSKSNNILDSTWFLGVATSLIKGVDCPHHSVYLDIVLYLSDKAKVIKNAICVFEENPSVPLRRHLHAEYGSFIYGGMSDASLVVRYITDMYHYDYIHDFVFHQNGVIEVKSTTTGHLNLPPYYKQNKARYGFEVADGFLGGIHDHFMMFKVDLDILGRKNSFKTIDLTVKKFADPWDPYPTFKKFLTHNKRKSESNATIRYNFDKPKYYIVYNENEKNKYGNVRGYRIFPQNKVKQVYPDDHIGTRATEWSKYQISVSKFKETERYGSCMFNYYDQYKIPRCSFDARIKDDENIENEDLVAWIPVGGLHIPSTEDFPTTPTIGNQFTFFIKPFNYFDEDPSFSSANSVYIEKTKTSKIVETYGTPEEALCGTPKRIID